jgi:ubiquinone/menaquinone biosynthesis C-methylase UbiE
MRGYAPAPAKDDGRYDAVADLYDTAFDDIRVRRDEWRWLTRQLDTRQAAPPRLLDIGCGNGALLMALADRLATGVGVDISPAMIERAQRRARAAAGSASHLRFVAIDGPQLPFPDASFDVVTSFLSFRYLDWDPIMGEIRRVLAPGGQLLIVDMVEKPLDVLDAPQLFRSTAQHLLRRIRNRRFDAALRRLTRDPAWQTMLKYNPIRAEHEYRWYLESRFPGRRLETLNVSRRHRLVAFNSGPLSPGHTAPLCYP